MLTYSFENIGSDSLYEYLYKCIKNDILNSELPPDYKLPSKRSFAKNLGISTITVENAYAQLVAEGFIYSLPKKGYYVSDILKNSGTLSYSTLKSDDITNLHITTSEITTPNNSNNQPDYLNYFADFTSNRTISDNFPFYTWTKLMKNVIADNNQEIMTPSPPEGILPLRTAIAKHLSDFRGMHVLPEQIIIGAGTEYLYSLIINLLGRENIFAVEDPGYNKIRQVYEANDVKCCCIPLDDDGIRVDALNENHADIIHISPSHHYPTGIVTSVSRRYELLSWASKNDNHYIIEDDYDSEFRLMGKPIPTLQSIDVSDKVIYMNTFTKSLTSTIRISYMILPPQLLKKFHENLSFYSCTVSNFEQYTLCKFIDDGHFEKHINRMRIFYKKQRDLLINTIKGSPLRNLISIQEKDSGLHFLMHVKTSLTDEELIKRAAIHNIKITCLSQYYHNKADAIWHILVINYSAIEPDKIIDAVNLLSKSLI